MLSAGRSSPIVRPRRPWTARPGRRDGSKESLPDELGAGRGEDPPVSPPGPRLSRRAAAGGGQPGRPHPSPPSPTGATTTGGGEAGGDPRARAAADPPGAGRDLGGEPSRVLAGLERLHSNGVRRRERATHTWPANRVCRPSTAGARLRELVGAGYPENATTDQVRLLVCPSRRLASQGRSVEVSPGGLAGAGWRQKWRQPTEGEARTALLDRDFEFDPGGDGWESNPPGTPRQRPADGFE